MTFGEPQFLYALAALPLLMILAGWTLARRAAALRSMGDPGLIGRLSMAVGWRMRVFRLVLWFLGVALLIIALAGPQWGSDIEIVEQRGVQVMVALDISGSMLAQDLKPTRLQRAKLEISDLISMLEGDEVGIVLFSGASFIQFPLTSDYATALTYLDQAGPEAITRQGTAVGEAIEMAVTGFNDQRVSQKILVIMTDGENHEGEPMAAARQASVEEVVIYTVGFGSPEGVPIPLRDEQGNVTGYRKDASGNEVLSRLDEATLRGIAEAGGGMYFPAAEDGAMAGLAGEIRSFQDESVQSEFSQRKVERFQLFLLAGALFIALSCVLTDRLLLSLGRRRPGPAGEAGYV